MMLDADNSYYARMAIVQASEIITAEFTRPFFLLKPKVYPDGDMWCVLYGENLQDGVAGFGNTPEAASYAFDKTWRTRTLKGKQCATCGDEHDIVPLACETGDGQ